MNELKRCPFCGVLPVESVSYTKCGAGELELAAYITCPKCGVYKRIKFNAADKPFDTFINVFKQVKEDWNKRVNE